MNYENTSLAPGLYIVATPIGTARDITLRALDILASADALFAEDTRTLRKLLDLHGVPLNGRRITSYHDHSAAAVRARVLDLISQGQSVAYASEAGTPLIADPGYGLVNDVREAGLTVTSAPGPSAVVTALSLAGLPTNRFLFLGFLPTASQARETALREVKDINATLVLYEAPKRVAQCLADAASILGETRPVALCRELTKRFEEIRRGTLGTLASELSGENVRGECVIVIGKPEQVKTNDAEIDAALNQALTNLRLKDAATAVAAALNLPRRKVYQRALELQATKEEQ